MIASAAPGRSGNNMAKHPKRAGCGACGEDLGAPNAPRLRSPHEVAAYLGVSVPNLYRLLRSGRLRGHKVGGQWRISEEALRQFLEDGIRVIEYRNLAE